MLIGCLWVAYACFQVSLMVSSTFLIQRPQGILLVSYGFLWQGYFMKCVTSMCSSRVSFFQPLYLFSGLDSVYRCPRSCCIYLLMCCPWVAYICFVVFLFIAWTCPWSSHRVCHVTLMHPCWVNVYFMRIVCWFHVEVLWVSFLLPLSMLWLSFVFPMCFPMESL